MKSYNPLEAPAPDEWLGMDESERIELIEQYHRQARTRLPNARMHASFHAIVENQAALGDETRVQETIVRLMAEGIDRHEAVHAVASVLSAHVFNILRGDQKSADPNAPYDAALANLTVAS